MYPSKPVRPVGVTLGAVLLGIFSALLLLGALGTAAISLLAKNFLAAQPSTGASPPPAGFLTGVFVVSALFYLLLAAWGISTTVGLVRLRNWARISTIVIGCGLVLIGLLSVMGTIMAQHMLATGQAPTTGGNPAALHTILLVYSVLWFLVIATGLWFIVYFAVRRTRDAFHAASAFAMAARAGYGSSEYAQQISLSQPTPLNPQDFYYAQPTAPAMDPALTAYPPATAAGVAYPEPLLKRRPTSMLVIGILFLVSGASQIIVSFMSIPFLLLGVLLQGVAAHVAIFILAAASLYAGIGLIKLWKPAWMVAAGLYAITAINCLLSMLPANIAKLREASHTLAARITPGFPYPAANANPMQQIFESDGFYQGMFGFSLLVIALVLMLLWRARWAYEPGALGPQEPRDAVTTV